MGLLRARSRARMRDDAGRDDAGMTLVELLMAMVVTSILVAGMATVFIGTLRAVRVTNIKTSTSADARIAMEAMSRTLRVAQVPSGEPSAIVVANTNALSFYSLINRTGTATVPDRPMLIEYSWDGTCLNEAQTPGRALTSTTPGGPESAWDTGRTSKCLARTAVPPVFSYYTTGIEPLPLPIPTGGLTAAVRPSVLSVQVLMTAQDPANQDISGIPVRDRVSLVNVQSVSGG